MRLQGHSEEAFAASYFNNGAIEGFPDKAVMEYTCVFNKKGIGHKRTYKMPPATVGVTQSLVEHQTLIADSIATNDGECSFSPSTPTRCAAASPRPRRSWTR